MEWYLCLCLLLGARVACPSVDKDPLQVDAVQDLQVVIPRLQSLLKLGAAAGLPLGIAHRFATGGSIDRAGTGAAAPCRRA